MTRLKHVSLDSAPVHTSMFAGVGREREGEGDTGRGRVGINNGTLLALVHLITVCGREEGAPKCKPCCSPAPPVLQRVPVSPPVFGRCFSSENGFHCPLNHGFFFSVPLDQQIHTLGSLTFPYRRAMQGWAPSGAVSPSLLLFYAVLLSLIVQKVFAQASVLSQNKLLCV